MLFSTKGKQTKTNSKTKKTSWKKGKVTSTQDTIPYEKVYEKGVIETEPGYFTKSYPLHDVNFKISSSDEQENIFSLYGELLNTIESDLSFEITINNRDMDMKTFEDNAFIGYAGDALDEYREVWNDVLRDKASQGKNSLNREKYLTVGLRAESYKEALNSFSDIDTNISNAIKKIIHKETSPISTVNRLNIFYDIFNLDTEIPFNTKFKLSDEEEKDTFSLAELKKMGLTSKDAIAPSSMEFKKDYFMIGKKYGRVLYLSGLPAFLKSDILIDISEAPYNMLTSIHFRSMPMGEAVKLIKRQIININANVITQQKRAIKSGYSPELVSTDLMKAQEEAKQLLEDLTGRNQKMFFATLCIMHFADSLEELNTATKEIQTRVSRHLVSIQTLDYQQEEGFATALPLAKNKIKAERLLTTEAASVFIPYSVQEYRKKDGMYYGLNAVSKNMILFNRKSTNNYNGFILGTPGSGKSFAAKQQIVSAILGTGDDVYIIDPEREYAPLMNLLGGESIRISIGGKNHINPFDMDIEYADTDDPISLKSDFICGLCDTVLGGKFGLSSVQISIIDRCVRLLYQPYLEEMERRKDTSMTLNKELTPTLEDFYDLLMAQDQPQAKELALALETYAVGSLNLFAHTTNVELNSRLITYDLKDIGSSMKEMGLQICLNDIWNRAIENRRRGKWTWVFIDEFYLLTQSDSSADFLQQIFKRARKWQCIPTGITQNIEDMLAQKQARTMISNCDFIMMLKQAPLDRKELAAMFNISPTQLSYVTNSEPGQGLIYTGESIIPFINNFPTDNKLYKVMSTKPGEVL